RQAIEELRRDRQESRWSFSGHLVTATTLGVASLLFVAGMLFGVVPSPEWLPGPPSPHRQEVAAPAPAMGRAQAQASSPQTDPPKPADAQATRAPTAPSPSASLPATVPASGEEDTTTATADMFRQYIQSLDLTDSAVRSTNGLLHAWGVDELQAG